MKKTIAVMADVWAPYKEEVISPDSKYLLALKYAFLSPATSIMAVPLTGDSDEIIEMAATSREWVMNNSFEYYPVG